MAKTYKPIQAVILAADIVEAVASAGAADATAVMKALDIRSYATVRSHLETLADVGWLNRMEDGDTFEIGKKLAGIWARFRSREEKKIHAAAGNLKAVGAPVPEV